ncbi:glutathione S-transferase family protein [Kordiimonas sp.]|uniref:glutathione S-transferase family protein n=1 Tax=Kordiimonas sp. TaxID=1970157 RepID=UPI003B5205E9
MTPVLFYGVPEGCSFGSIVALEWLGKPYRLCRIEMMDGSVMNDFSSINTVAETPSYITEDGRIIHESAAILAHIGARSTGYSKGFVRGGRETDTLNEMLAFLNTSFFGAFSPLWHTLEHEMSETEKSVLTAYGKTLVQKAHADLQRKLNGRQWLAGLNPTIADAYFMGLARWADFHSAASREDYPALNRLYERLEGDPAVKFAHAIEEGTDIAVSSAFQGHISLEEAQALIKP